MPKATHTLITIRPDGSRAEEFGTADWTDIRPLVGGYIEAIPLWRTFEGHRCIAYCDEEGRIKKDPIINHEATHQWSVAMKQPAPYPLVGNVVIVIKGDVRK